MSRKVEYEIPHPDEPVGGLNIWCIKITNGLYDLMGFILEVPNGGCINVDFFVSLFSGVYRMSRSGFSLTLGPLLMFFYHILILRMALVSQRLKKFNY